MGEKMEHLSTSIGSDKKVYHNQMVSLYRAMILEENDVQEQRC
jgi:hypothetical protein